MKPRKREQATAKSGTPEPPRGGTPPLDPVEEASRESFPASDAPAWIGTRIGGGGERLAGTWP